MENQRPDHKGWGEEDGIVSGSIRDFTRRHGFIPVPEEIRAEFLEEQAEREAAAELEAPHDASGPANT